MVQQLNGTSKRSKRRIAFFLAACLSLASSVLLGETRSLKSFEFSLIRMGTSFRIVFYAPERRLATQAATKVFERVEQIEQILSDYREDSEVNGVCRNAHQSPQSVSPDLFFILEKSLYFSELSGGAFDVTIGPVVRLWREARHNQRLPDAERLSKARLAVGYQNVILDPNARMVFLKRDDMVLDLGAIAKGYAADQALAMLREYGFSRALVDAGGDLSLGDSPPGTRGWDVQIRNWTPESRSESHWLQLHNVAIATSGDTFQFLKAKGQHFSHIINPSDALGVRDSVITVVIAPDGTTADALATTFSILPVSKAMSLADSVENVSAYLVRRKGKELLTFASRRFPHFSTHPQFLASPKEHDADPHE